MVRDSNGVLNALRGICKKQIESRPACRQAGRPLRIGNLLVACSHILDGAVRPTKLTKVELNRIFEQ